MEALNGDPSKGYLLSLSDWLLGERDGARDPKLRLKGGAWKGVTYSPFDWNAGLAQVWLRGAPTGYYGSATALAFRSCAPVEALRRGYSPFAQNTSLVPR